VWDHIWGSKKEGNMATARNDNQKLDPEQEKPVFSWESPEFIRQKRSLYWYIVVVIVVALLCLFMYSQKLWVGMVLVVLSALVILFFAQIGPRSVKCALYNKGLVLDNAVYEFNRFKSFWITFTNIPKVRLQLTGRLSGQVIMPLGDSDPEQIRLYLSRHLPEDDKKSEDLIEVLNELIKF